VVFSFETLLEKGHPSYRVLLRDVAGVEALGRLLVRFEFKPGEHRDLPLIVAAMPVLSQAYWSGRDFAKTTLEPPLASGPYRVAKVDPGRSIAFRRDPDYWARDLPVNLGRYNYDSIRFDYYRDRGIALEAFFAGEYDFREEFTSKSWATEYDKPPVRKGLIVREVLPDETPSGVQAFFLNVRRAKFADRRTRAALGYAFDFGWTNKNIFYGLYKRTTSMFENSELAAKAPPAASELALLEPYRGRVPEQVFERPFAPPETDGSGNPRRNLRQALKLLSAAGWTVRGGKLRDAAGEQLTVEFLMFEPTFQRVIAPYIRNLERLGIEARMRIVDLANFEYRMEHFDFDITVRRYVQPLTPGIEQRGLWTSAYAGVVGANNIAGIENPVVDALVETVIGAKSRDELTTAARALDRVLMANHYVVPHWYKGSHTIAYWNKFSRPKIKPRYARGVLDTWWVDAEKERLLAAGRPSPKG
jgi:microcin C transport system substrate-binding protein